MFDIVYSDDISPSKSSKSKPKKSSLARGNGPNTEPDANEGSENRTDEHLEKSTKRVQSKSTKSQLQTKNIFGSSDTPMGHTEEKRPTRNDVNSNMFITKMWMEMQKDKIKAKYKKKAKKAQRQKEQISNKTGNRDYLLWKRSGLRRLQ